MFTEITQSTIIENSSHIIMEEPSHPVTPYTLTLVLAYLHYYTPKRQSNGRFLAPKHLRNLADWIGHPAPQLRSIRRHKPLAAHMALLHAAGFLASEDLCFTLQPTVTARLHDPLPDVIRTLLQAIENSDDWTNTLLGLGLQDTLTEAYTAYLQQSLVRQLQADPATTSQAVIWYHDESEVWRLSLPRNLPLWLHFDLRQLGVWSPEQPLTCTPLSIATAVQRGYGCRVIQWLLETATQQPLSLARQTRLNQWSQRAHAYRLRTVYLLSTAQAGQMASLLRKKRMRQTVIEHISPRHAIVTAGMAARLKNYLAKNNYPLSDDTAVVGDSPPNKPAAAQWLGLRVLTDLGQLIPLPCPPPHSALAQLETQLDAGQKTELEALATTILQNVSNAIRGRDAFFPAQKDVPPEWIEAIRCAIAREQEIDINYQTLGDWSPSCRRVQPLRLEERGNLFYLHAYCTRAEMNLTFRLDRIQEII